MIYVKLLTSEFQGLIPSFFRIPDLKSRKAPYLCTNYFGECP